MKKIFLFLSTVLFGLSAYGQVSESAINTDISYIKIHSYDAMHSGGTFQDIALSRLPSLASTASGTNSYTASVNPLILSYTTNFIVAILFPNSNTGASTLTLNSITTIAIKKMVSGVPTALSSGDIQAGAYYWLFYDGAQFQIDLGGSGGGGGAGTVTTISVTTANGVSGSVANPTTTPAITLSLGAITPSSVAASGSVSGSNLTGTNTGDQTVILTGDVTGTGTGSFATTIKTDVGLAGNPTTTTQSAGNNSTRIATTAYTDAAVASVVTGTVFKAASNYKTVTALSANTYSNGASGVGATLTKNSNGAISVDGASPTVGQRILVDQESTGSHNGIYTVTTVGDGSNPFVLTRATDYDQSAEIFSGTATAIVSGSTFTGTIWLLSTTGTVTVGTTALTFIQIQGPLPAASPSTAGIANLYSSLGTNTNGSIDQNTANTNFNLKANLASPTFSGTPSLPTGTTATTQNPGDNSTKLATSAFVTTAVNNAISGVNPAVAVQATTTANVSGYTYNNGVGGIGATLTQNSAAIVVVDGYTLLLNDRVLFKNQTTSANNGIYLITTLGTGIIPAVFTRALDYNQPSSINNSGTIPVVNGTVNALTSWLLTSSVTTVGSDPLTYTIFSYSPTALISEARGGTGNGPPSAGDILVGNSSNNYVLKSIGILGQILAVGASSTTQWITPLWLAIASNFSDVSDPGAALDNLGATYAQKNTQTGNYTIQASDFNQFKEIIFNNSSSATLTVPDGLSITDGKTVQIRRIGAGSVTVVQGGSQVVTGSAGNLILANQNVVYALRYDNSSNWSLQNGLPNPLAVADGTTIGVAGFTAADFNSSAGIISLDYTNGQSASSSTKGFVTSTDWNSFYNRLSANQDILIMQALGSTIKGETFGCHATESSTTLTLTNQQIRFTAVYISQAATLTGIKMIQTTAGSYTANNNNRVGLYSYSGGTLTQVAASTNDGNVWQTAASNSVLTIPFTSTYSAAAGVYFVAFIYNRSGTTTDPIFAACASISNAIKATLDLTNSAKIYSQLATQTDLPSPTQAMSGLTTSTSIPYCWVY